MGLDPKSLSPGFIRCMGKRPEVPLTIAPAVKETGVKLNKTEARYHEILKRRARQSGDAYFGATIRVMPFRFQLGFKTSYLPDFEVVPASPLSKIILIEVKGAFTYEDSRVKFRAAARMFPEFRWIWAQYRNGNWTETEYK